MEKTNKKVAILIDGENVNAKNAKQIFDTMSSYGEVVIRQIFADWSKQSVLGWRKEIATYSMVAQHQFSFVSKKNTSDLMLVIQAMIILFEKDIDVFCIVSSDSDFTRLVQELRERNKEVIGMGGRTSIKSFVNSFSEFLYLGEEIVEETELEVKPEPKEEPKPIEIVKPALKPLTKPEEPEKKYLLEEEKILVMKEIIDRLIDETGHALYSQISNEMKNKFSDFVPKNYNCKSLKYLMDKEVLPRLKEYDKVADSNANNPSSAILSLVKKQTASVKKTTK